MTIQKAIEIVNENKQFMDETRLNNSKITILPDAVPRISEALGVLLSVLDNAPSGKLISESEVIEILNTNPNYNRYWDNIASIQRTIEKLDGITIK